MHTIPCRMSIMRVLSCDMQSKSYSNWKFNVHYSVENSLSIKLGIALNEMFKGEQFSSWLFCKCVWTTLQSYRWELVEAYVSSKIFFSKHACGTFFFLFSCFIFRKQILLNDGIGYCLYLSLNDLIINIALQIERVSLCSGCLEEAVLSLVYHTETLKVFFWWLACVLLGSG